MEYASFEEAAALCYLYRHSKYLTKAEFKEIKQMLKSKTAKKAFKYIYGKRSRTV